MDTSKILLERLTYVESRGQQALATQRKDGYSTYVDSAPFNGYRSAALSFIKSTLGESHIYYQEFQTLTERLGYYELIGAIEILKSLRAEIENNWLQSFKSLVSAEIFTDFFEMAEHLIDNGYKDPAAVLIGSVLEEHLRQLCAKNNIETTFEKSGDQIPKKADRLNSDLAANQVYNKLDQKNITAWLGLRNNAAHGHYDEYKLEQVQLMYSGISDFIARNQV